ncbi:hypothetical protein [Lysobacter sp. HA18]
MSAPKPVQNKAAARRFRPVLGLTYAALGVADIIRYVRHGYELHALVSGIGFVATGAGFSIGWTKLGGQVAIILGCAALFVSIALSAMA